MLAKNIKVGGLYTAKISNKIVDVRVDAIREVTTSRVKYPHTGRVIARVIGDRQDGTTKVYDVTNLSTGRKTTFRSAAKFRTEIMRGVGGKIPTAAITETNSELAKSFTVPGVVIKDQSPLGQAELTPVSLPSPSSSLLGSKFSQPSQITQSIPHVIVEARAGSGKTTTLLEGLKIVMGLPTSLTPSPQQRAVWDSMALSKGARTVCFVAFNKSIANELKARVPAGVSAMTMHSLGFSAVKQNFTLLGGERSVNAYRTQNLIEELMGRDIRELKREKPLLIKAVEELVGLCKMNLTEEVSWENYQAWRADQQKQTLSLGMDQLISHYEIDMGGVSRQEVYDLVPKILERAKDVARDGYIDYDDMIWIPIALNLSLPQYDLLLVDEAQDLNRCQQSLAKRVGKRLILCGDPKQAIYGFAGADSDSMPRMGRELAGCNICQMRQKMAEKVIGPKVQEMIDSGVLPPPTYKPSVSWEPCGNGCAGCITLPLTVTRRCGKAIVKEANKIVKDFDAFETNPEGQVLEAQYTEREDSAGKKTEIPYEKTYMPLVKDGDMVLCRCNAPLVSQCFKFLRKGHKATIQGRDVGKGLISTVEKMKATSVNDLVEKLDNWLHKETTKEQAKRNPSESHLINLQDKYDCLLCFTEGLTYVQQVIDKINSVFTDNKDTPGIKFSSGHKSKGLEAKNVFILQVKNASVPHPMAKSAWQKEQESNLHYVMITRAIECLTFVY